jgi:hypothetical protein
VFDADLFKPVGTDAEVGGDIRHWVFPNQCVQLGSGECRVVHLICSLRFSIFRRVVGGFATRQ